MKIEQIEVGEMAVFAYIVSCTETKDALVIDPGGDEEKLWKIIQKQGLNLKYIVNTHGHGDHTYGNAKLKKLSNAKIVIHEKEANHMGPSPSADKTLKDKEILTLGKLKLKTIHTPGHSSGGMCLLVKGNLFTGDTLFVGAVGRYDIRRASEKQLIDTFKNKLMTLPEDTVVWPGHDYGPTKHSTIGNEKKTNSFLVQILEGS
ncbi:MAG: MBL fold metallo-hydrolase [bacterium]|nr:MBL fold metallo-hydrolase [bacterium]